MDALPVELLRLIFSSCDFESVRNLREGNRLLALVGYEYLLPPQFQLLSWRRDVDRLLRISNHEQLRGSIDSVVFNLSPIVPNCTRLGAQPHGIGGDLLTNQQQEGVLAEVNQIQRMFRSAGRLYAQETELEEALSSLPNLKDLEVTFTKCPSNMEMLQDCYDVRKTFRADPAEACKNLNAIVSSLSGTQLSSFSVDCFPLDLFRIQSHRRHWFTHAKSFASLTRLSLTLDPSGLKGPASAKKAVNGLGWFLQIPRQLRSLKLAFHSTSGQTKYQLSFREMLRGQTFHQLTDLALEGVTCQEQDLKYFLASHGTTLARLRLGGPGLANPYEVSRGGLYLSGGTFKSLFTSLNGKVPSLERLHLEGMFECQQRGLSSHEMYKFYPLTNEDWEDIPPPSWIHESRNAVSCLPFEQYVFFGGSYPGGNSLSHHNY